MINFIKKRPQDSCFLVKLAKSFWIPSFKEHLRWLLLSINSGYWGIHSSNRKPFIVTGVLFKQGEEPPEIFYLIYICSKSWFEKLIKIAWKAAFNSYNISFQTYSTSLYKKKFFCFSFAPATTCSGHSVMFWANVRRQRNLEIDEVFFILGNWVSIIIFTSNVKVELSF